MSEIIFRNRWNEFRRRVAVLSIQLGTPFDGSWVPLHKLHSAAMQALLANLTLLFSEAVALRIPDEELAVRFDLAARLRWLNEVGQLEDFDGLSQMRRVTEAEVRPPSFGRRYNHEKEFSAAYAIVERQLLAWELIQSEVPVTVALSRSHSLARFIVRPTEQDQGVSFRLVWGAPGDWEGEWRRVPAPSPIDDLSERIEAYSGIAEHQVQWASSLTHRVEEAILHVRSLFWLKRETAGLREVLDVELDYLQELVETTGGDDGKKVRDMHDQLQGLVGPMADLHQRLMAANDPGEPEADVDKNS
jgi:hypothetical protein